MTDLANPRTPSATQAIYVERVNRGIDYVLGRLGEPIRLEDVARAACFSPFHFHRVFRALVGETLNAFVKRLRLERALTLMSHSRRRPLTQIELACGFSSSSDFSRSFKQRSVASVARGARSCRRRSRLRKRATCSMGWRPGRTRTASGSS